ncbi:MAG: DUF2079 domain-containing protein [Conexivisphaerales archaeon]
MNEIRAQPIQRQFLNFLQKDILSYLKKWSHIIILGTAIIIYGTLFSHLTVRKHSLFQSYAFDLGIFNQAMYTTLYNHKLFYYTPELWLNPSGCYLAVHFSPILFLIIPFYAVYPSPEFLLIFQSYILAAASIPLYLIAKEILKNKNFALLIAIVYLLYPPLHGANWFDFHQQSFIPILIFSMFYFYLKKNWKPYILTALLSLMIEEHLVYIVFSIGLYNFVKETISMRKATKNESNSFKIYLQKLKKIFSVIFKQKEISTSLFIIILSIIWYLLIAFIKSFSLIKEEFIDIYRATDTFKVLGFKGEILQLPIHILLNPQKVYEALSFDYHIKFLYILILFSPLLFICFRSKFSILVLLVLVPILLTNYLPYYTIGAQYPLYLISLVFIAEIKGLSGLSTLSLKRILKIIFLLSLIFTISVSPISPLSYKFAERSMLWYPYPLIFSPSAPKYVENLHEMLSLIPSNASILTINEVFPHVSSRINAFLIPLAPTFSDLQKNETIAYYVKQLINESDFILLNPKDTSPWVKFALKEIQKSNEIGIYAISNPYVLFKRNYTGAAIFIPYGRYYILESWRDFILDLGKIVNDPVEGRFVVFSSKGVKDDGYIFYGPYISLPPGKFKVSFEIKVQEAENGLIASFDVADNYGTTILAQRDLYNNELKDNWFNVTLFFTNNEIRFYVEFRIKPTGLANIYVNNVILEYDTAS